MKPARSFGERFVTVLVICGCIGKGELVSFQRGCRLAGREGCWEDGGQGEGCMETCDQDRCNGETLGYGTWEREPLFQIAGSDGERVAKSNASAPASLSSQLFSMTIMIIMIGYAY
ncbi:PREDICTED: uncharacterized protein LOC109480548 [Branchiostoma belcheri]|uniref:Uncharacterized protein LOC109480548 n=1 Tax=Branchiostoma belcheri TaxID=7741 RepID=A0A6P4ZNH6_BRABE|nr:PREDICTED: uncharacterized protein LOC109480548 [Branchiostoma belcheri]